MYKIEFHCHTKYSKCSNLEPRQILQICKARGLRGVMICDHDTIKGILAFKKILKSEDDFILIPGIEIATNRGEIIGAWIEEMPSSNEFPEVAEKIREQDGMVILPHPFDKMRRSVFKYREDDLRYIDAVEVLNSRCIWPNANKKALKFAKINSLLMSAGSDAHFASEIGNAWISFNGNTSEEMKRVFKLGKTIYGGKTAPFSLFFYMATHRVRRTLKQISYH
ncbi:MAG: PHP domain-containing protein [Candidatus Hodarchaeota archaeon]